MTRSPRTRGTGNGHKFTVGRVASGAGVLDMARRLPAGHQARSQDVPEAPWPDGRVDGRAGAPASFRTWRARTANWRKYRSRAAGAFAGGSDVKNNAQNSSRARRISRLVDPRHLSSVADRSNSSSARSRARSRRSRRPVRSALMARMTSLPTLASCSASVSSRHLPPAASTWTAVTSPLEPAGTPPRVSRIEAPCPRRPGCGSLAKGAR